MRLEIEPTTTLTDEAPSVKVVGCPPEREVKLTIAATDAKDHRWESQNVYRADATGTVDIARDAPVSGSYASTDPTGPIWSMRFASEDVAPSMFAAPWNQLQFTLDAEAGGETGSGLAVRRWSGPGVTRSEIRGEGFVGFLEEMERDRDALLDNYARMAPEALNALVPEERHQVYRILRLRAAIMMDGSLDVSGTFGEGDVFCPTATPSLSRFESTKLPKARFYALLSNGTREVRFERVSVN